MPARRCKDCPPETKREAPYPGPRCATHHREVKKTRSKAAHERMVTQTYQDMAFGDYDRLYEQQGRVCAICAWATGATKRLAVDHDHATGRVRGLLCSPCNRMVGYLRNDPAAFLRGFLYLLASVADDPDAFQYGYDTLMRAVAQLNPPEVDV